MKEPNRKPVSIAILPFQNISLTKELDYLVEGFTEDLITDLSRYSSLRVISKYSTQQIQTHDANAERLIPELKTDYLVKGSFMQKARNIRINAKLIQMQQDTIVWSNRHDAEIDQLFDIHDELIEQLVSALQREVDIDLLTASKSRSQKNLAAYELWLMGMNELKKGNLDADNKGREYFQNALEIEPNYSRAFAGLSMSYFNEWSCQFWERWDYSQKGAFEFARKAVELDDSNYFSMTVLGRLFIYKGDWIQAEHYLRKSLRLNPNDTDNLMQIASCFIYLGYLSEAEKLYQRTLKLNPINTDWYFSFASVLYFEIGDFEQCIKLGRKTDFQKVMVDMSAFIAAAYFHIGDLNNMMIFWNKYLELFQEKVLRGNQINEEEALKWVINVNPYKEGTNLIPFAQFMAEKFGFALTPDSNRTSSLHVQNQFILKNNIWELAFDGKSVLLPDAKGFHDILKLISLDGQEIHCLSLMGGGVSGEETAYSIDDKAKAAYKDKLDDLKEDIHEAIEMNDHVRAELLQNEYDKIVDFLAQSMGLGGKQRKINDQSDKARSAVTWRIRSAIKKIRESHELLANHLNNTIKTGTFCSYKPATKIKWVL